AGIVRVNSRSLAVSSPPEQLPHPAIRGNGQNGQDEARLRFSEGGAIAGIGGLEAQFNRLPDIGQSLFLAGKEKDV
ncbi:MAG: hypothetical protein ACLFU6_11840, partial [Candidatus Hydrogenedentota bacterium]